MTEKKPAPWRPEKPQYDEVVALQALALGQADAHQQVKALDFIIHSICSTYDQSYFPESDRDTCFAEGKRFVGNRIRTLIKVKPEIYKPKG